MGKTRYSTQKEMGLHAKHKELVKGKTLHTAKEGNNEARHLRRQVTTEFKEQKKKGLMQMGKKKL